MIEFVQNFLTIIKDSWNWFRELNDIIQILFLLFTYGLFVKYTKKLVTKYLSKLGLLLFQKYEYIQSFFHDEKMVNIAFYMLPLLVINYFTFGTHLSTEKQEFTLFTHSLYIVNYLFTGYWLSNFLRHTVQYLNTKDKYKDKPLVSFSQIIFLIFVVMALATIYAHFTNQSPKTLFTTLSVMSMAIFWTLRDVILGIVATMLIITNDIVKVGDWVKNEKYHADGDVIEINLITVKVLNYDKTIATIPTYSFISEGFKNRQEILNSGKRLIQYSFRIEATSVRYLSDEEIEKFMKIDLLHPYIEKRLNNENIHDDLILMDTDLSHLNRKRITNLGLFRKYVEKMVENNGMVLNDKSKKAKENGENVVIRILEGNREGIGLELYCFSKKTEWGEYNYLIYQLTEEIYASATYFDLIINS